MKTPRRVLMAAFLAVGLSGCLLQGGAVRAPCDANAVLRNFDQLAALTPEEVRSEHAWAREDFESEGDECTRFHLILLSILVSELDPGESDPLKLLSEYLADRPGAGESLMELAELLSRLLQGRAAVESLRRDALELAERREKECAREKERIGREARPPARSEVSLPPIVLADKVPTEVRTAEILDEYARQNQPSQGKDAPGVRVAKLVSRLIKERLAMDAGQKEMARKLAEAQARADSLKQQLDELRAIEKIINERERQ